MAPDDFHRDFNYAEAAFWAVLGLGFIYAGVVQNRRFVWWPAGLLLAFGATDVVEVHTGAWWKPWWLGVVKVGITAGLMLCAWAHYRRQARSKQG